VTSKVLAVATLLVTVTPVIVFGRFENEFLRLNIIFSALLFTYFGDEHWLIRSMAMAFHVFVALQLDYLYMREYIMQLACSTKGKRSTLNS